MKKFLGVFLALMFWMACEQSPQIDMQKIEGETMGTTYHISYYDTLNRNLKPNVDSILQKFNQSVSTYIPTSIISQFNKADSLFEGDRMLLNVWFLAQSIAYESKGAFDPTVMPLVNYWGFGYKEKKHLTKVDSAKVDSIKQFIGYTKVKVDGNVIRKEDPRMELDLSAIAKGYGVDLVATYFERQNIMNFFIEIGGEVRAKGLKADKSDWIVGIEKPDPDISKRSLQKRLSLKNKSMATSGNYRNFYELEGENIGHTINPTTGYPEQNNMLSASVIHQSCGVADGYATAFMAMGYEKARYLLSQRPALGLEVVFVYLDENNQPQVWEYLKGE